MSAEAVDEPGDSQDAATRSSIREALERTAPARRCPRVYLQGAAVERLDHHPSGDVPARSGHRLR